MEVSPAVIGALITAVASLIVSVMTIFSTRMNAKASAQLQQQMERMRQMNDVAAKGAVIADKELSECLESLKRGVAAIQAFKDEMQLMLDSLDGSLPVGTLVARLQSKGEALQGAYQECKAHLSAEEDAQFHAAKNIAIALTTQIERNPPQYAPSKGLTPDYAAMLLGMRARLSDAQQFIRDSRAARIEARLCLS